MTPAPPPIPRQPSVRDDAVAIIRRLRDSRHVAYLAGGCVRDELLGLAPKDFDVATDAPPDRVRQLFSKTQAVGAAFGVILVRSGRSMIEVATFRTDGTYSDGRHPDSITFTTAEADARRRDFTINGLFLDPIENRVIDHVGGQDDLRAKVLRAIGDPQHRFAEDYLRMLRAARFAARFGLTIEPSTEAAIRKYAPKLIEISPERIADELRAMLTPASRTVAWRQLWSLGLIGQIMRFLAPPPSAPAPNAGAWRADERIGLFEHVRPDETASFPLSLAVASLAFLWQCSISPLLAILSTETAAHVARTMRKALRISNEEQDSVQAILRLSSDIIHQPRTVARIKRFLASADASDAKALLEAILRVPGHDGSAVEQALGDVSKFSGSDVAPPPLVTGDDLVAAGLQPGSRFKRILDRTYDEQLEGRIATRQEAMQFALQVE